MQQSEHQHNLTEDIHIRYVFRQLSPEEESRFEVFLDAHPHEADIVEGIQQFCEDRGIRTREAFDKAWEKEMAGVQENLIRKEASPINTPPPQNNWKLTAYILLSILALGVYWHFGEIKKQELKLRHNEQAIVRMDSIIALRDSVIRALQGNQEQLPDTFKSPPTLTPRCQLSPTERKKWHASFIVEEIEHLTSAGSNDAKGSWQEQLKEPNNNEAKAFRLLKEKAEISPQSMQPVEYYVLGSMCLLYRPSPAEAVAYLEKAKGVFRPAYKKIMLAAYLENKQYEKAKAWAKDQIVLRKDWPMGAEPCLK